MLFLCPNDIFFSKIRFRDLSLVTLELSKLRLALPYGFEEEDGGRDGDVEGIQLAEHGNADMGIGCLSPYIGEAGALGAHDNGGGA